jgi:hypothetical protein
MMVMNYMIYVSTSTVDFTETELATMLHQSRERNQNNGITGILLYNRGTFFQLLEGDAEQLKYTFNDIKVDPRHKNIIKLKAGTLLQRNFPEWCMGFTTLVPGSLRNAPGFVDPARKEFLHQCNSTRPELSLLKSFALANNFAF